MRFKRLTLILSSTIALTACNGGGGTPADSTNQQLAKAMTLSHPNEPLQVAVLKALQGTEDHVLNFDGAMFISYGQTYQYEISTQDMEKGGEQVVNKGTFVCASPSSCILNIGKEIQPFTTYAISISDNGKLVGGTSFFYDTSELQVKDADISPNSTSLYLYAKLSSRIKDIERTEFERTELNLYKKALDYKPGLTINTMRYAYFIYLTTINKLSDSDAINNMVDTYSNCYKDPNQCRLDDKFMSDPTAIDKALSAVAAVMQQYLKDKGNTKIAEAKKWFDENIKGNLDKIVGAKDAIGGGIDFFIPGAGGKTKEGIKSVKNGLIGISDFYFNAMGVTDSQAALERLKVFNENLSKSYTAAMPTMEETTLSILKELQKQAKYVVFNDFYNDLAIIHNSYTVANSELIYNKTPLSITDYFKTHHDINGVPFTDSFFSWIAKKGNTDSGIFDSEMQMQRVAAITRITNPATIDSLSDAVKSSLTLDQKQNVNIILQRHQYNQMLVSSLLKSIEVLEQSMYLDNMALLIISGPYGKDWKGTINYVFTTLGKVSVTGDYKTDYIKMSSIYKTRKDQLVKEYYDLIVPEKKYVADNVLQTLEIEGKCNISATDGLNTLGATCPKYQDDGRGGRKTIYISSTLNKPDSRCLTTNPNGSGDITKIAGVRNINGTIGCLIDSNTDMVKMPRGGSVSIPKGQIYGEFSDTILDPLKIANVTTSSILRVEGRVGNPSYGATTTLSGARTLDQRYNFGESGIGFLASDLTTYTGDLTKDHTSVYDKYGNLLASLFYNFDVEWGSYGIEELGYPVKLGLKFIYSNQKITQNTQNKNQFVIYNGDDKLNIEFRRIHEKQVSYFPYTMSIDNTYGAVVGNENYDLMKSQAVQSVLSEMQTTLSPTLLNSCKLTRFDKERRYADGNGVRWKHKDYDIVNASFSCNADKEKITLKLVPGGRYDYNSSGSCINKDGNHGWSSGGICMQNYDDWEKNPDINPLISNQAATYKGVVMYGEVEGKNMGSSSYRQDDARAFFSDQGRYHMRNFGASIENGSGINLSLPRETRLVAPVPVNFDGYRNFGVWKSNSGNYRFDEYGKDVDNATNKSMCNIIANDYGRASSMLSINGKRVCTSKSDQWVEINWVKWF